MQLGSKKYLLHNLRNYYAQLGRDVFAHVPLTYHIQHGLVDIEFATFVRTFSQLEEQKNNGVAPTLRNIWIVKPGEETNRGQGIVVLDDV
jgi:hypothetical protein